MFELSITIDFHHFLLVVSIYRLCSFLTCAGKPFCKFVYFVFFFVFVRGKTLRENRKGLFSLHFNLTFSILFYFGSNRFIRHLSYSPLFFFFSYLSRKQLVLSFADQYQFWCTVQRFEHRGYRAW